MKIGIKYIVGGIVDTAKAVYEADITNAPKKSRQILDAIADAVHTEPKDENDRTTKQDR